MLNERLCTVEGCGAAHAARGWCNKHYKRWCAYGDPLGEFERDPVARFAQYVSAADDDCLLWVGDTHYKGYGVFKLEGKTKKAHRVAWEWANGPIPEGMMLDHKCHNRACVNVAHLRVVTNKQNQEHRPELAVTNKSGYRGVFWNTKRQKWQTKVAHDYKHIYLGLYECKELAAEVVRLTRLELYTHNDQDMVA